MPMILEGALGVTAPHECPLCGCNETLACQWPNGQGPCAWKVSPNGNIFCDLCVAMLDAIALGCGYRR